MKKILTAALAALTLGGAMIATATPAAAHGYGGYHGGYGGWHGGYGYRGGYGVPLVAGLAGLAVGAALVGGPHYYGPAPYYYGPARPYGVCYGASRVWDPYAGGWVMQRTSYPC